MKLLRDLNFIDIKAGRAGPMSHAIIWNPHFVIRWHHQQKTSGLLEASYTALLEWALDVGAKDMTEDTPLASAWLKNEHPAKRGKVTANSVTPTPSSAARSLRKEQQKSTPANKGSERA
jgi:hypothetical protein